MNVKGTKDLFIFVNLIPEKDIVYFPNAQAIHYYQGSSSNDPVRCTLENVSATLRYWKKHHGRIGMTYITLMQFSRNLLQVITNFILYTTRRSERKNIAIKIKKNIAVLRWLLAARGLN